MSSFSCYDRDKNDWQQTIDVARQVINSLEKQVETYQIKADQTTGKIMPIEHVGDTFGRRYTDIGSYKGESYYADNSPSKCAERARVWANKTFAEAKEKHDKNIVGLENNKAIIERVKLFMQNLGIPSTFSTRDYKSRSRYPKYNTETAGYIQDLERNCKTNDGWSQVEPAYNRMIEDIEKYLAIHAKEEEVKKRALEAEATAKERELQRAALVVKYGLEYTADWETILETILSKNKYLRLAHYLEKNRGDWSEGYDYAETGINGFTAESEQDKDIETCIRGHIEDWCGDGRIFRDCEWNYGRIFGLVDNADLLKDYEIANKQ